MAKKPQAPKDEPVKAVSSNPGEISTGKREPTKEKLGNDIERETF